MSSYIIRDATEETACDWCGWPLYPGDRAFPLNDGAQAFCTDTDRRAWVNAEKESHLLDGCDCHAERISTNA